MNKIKQIWNNLQASFWFVPTVIIIASILLAVAFIEIDASGSKPWMDRWPRLFGASAQGARGMLSTIAGSMMTVVGVTFSMTLVTLALASSQYTSRILRNFMRDRMTQVVLGIFAGVFTYCLLVLRTIRGGEADAFVPSLAVAFAVVLAIGGISVLIYFIHHIASSIQASNIIASVAAETVRAVDRLVPKGPGQEPMDEDDAPSADPLPERQWKVVTAPRSGYIQEVNNAALLRLAREQRTIVRMERGIGEFVVDGTALASLALEAAPGETIVGDVQAAYTINRHRTVEQDAAFGVRQIVDMALRALSPGINDTTTAIMCVNYLSVILARLASRPLPSSRLYEEGELRMITVALDFAGLMAESFDQIRVSAAGNVAVLLQLLLSIQTLAGVTVSRSRRLVLRENVRRIAEVADRTLKFPDDQVRFESLLARVRAELVTQ